MSTNNQDLDANLIKGHEYDGIQELDNPLPTWWLISFFATIIFSFIYWIHYDITQTGLSPQQEMEAEMARIDALRAQSSQAGGGESGGADLESLMGNTAALASGKDVYIARCAACHGQSGEGMIGPNLTDYHWLHGASPKEILKVVEEGVLEKGMPAWKDMLKPDEVLSVTAYIVSLKGTNVANGKKPEGVEIKE